MAMVIGDTYYKHNQKYKKLLKERGTCELIWKSRNYNGDLIDKDHIFHRCRRFHRHRSNHKCNCGATAKLEYNASNSNRKRAKTKALSNSKSNKSKKSS